MVNNTRYIIDSNVFYAFFVSDDSLHELSFQMLESIQNDEWITTYGVVQEVATLLTYRKWKVVANSFIEYLLDAWNIIILTGLPTHDMRVFLEHDKKMWFVDLSILDIVMSQDIQLVSFDKQLLSYYRQLQDSMQT